MEVKDRAGLPEQTAADSEKRVEKPKRKGSRKRSITIFAIVSLVNVGLLVFLWTQLLTPASNTKSQDPLIGHAAPNFTLALLGSRPTAGSISTASYKGKPFIVNFWNSTCGPCIDEAPLLQQQWTQLQKQGIGLIGVDFQDTTSGGLGFLQKYGITYPNVMDSSGSTAINYGVTGTPETLFINRQGIVVSRVSGELSPQTWQQNLQLISH
ncbi:MAG TPA: redoxin domain-containing protein [Ktedonobacteraceae bacterium]|jgi:cytochrome c biogenesis protein CcmG/thiol:disulfide interchange protein DsbE|nr:redoxin domain-containing protein [Ktedonobacteraceae bacterium]